MRQTAWAFAKAGLLDEAFFAALVEATAPRLGEFNPQDLANTAWAFAKAGLLDEALFVALAMAAAPRLGKFSPQNLARRGRLRRLDIWIRSFSLH